MSIRSLYPDIRPSLLLDFANAKQLDPRITFTRTSTATYVGADGLIKTAGIGQPRFDHDPITGESLGLLIEESRTNLITYSEEFSNTSWIKSNITITSNAIVAPDGALTGDRLDFSATNNVPWFYKDQGTTGTPSLFVKYDNWQYVKFRSGGELNFALFDLINGTASVGGSITNASITPVGNGWFRIWANTNNQRYDFRCTNSTANDFITGSGSVFIWGAQLEAGSFPTSYIPTAGSSVTRSTDIAGISGTNFSSWYNPYAGTAFIDIIPKGISNSLAYQTYFSFNSSSGNRWGIAQQNGAAGSYVAESVIPYVGVGGQFSNTPILNTFTEGQPMSLGLYQPNGTNIQSVRDGGSIQSVTTTRNPAITNLLLGGVISDNSGLMGHIQKFAYYPKRLTNDQLQTLTK